VSDTEYAVKLSNDGIKLRGAARSAWFSKEPELVLSGPYETGKTFGALHKVHNLCVKYPGTNALFARKQYAALVNSAYQTFIKKVLPYPPGHELCPVTVFGGGRPEVVNYPNGSRIVIGGMDNSDKILSAEYDLAYINQAEELLLDDHEKLLSRTTGRAGNMPYSQVILDCNPGPPNHWLLKRVAAGKLRMFNAVHQDNPSLWDDERQEWTAQGKITMERLYSLTGLRYKRGVLGLWAGSEGQVYDAFDEAIHIIDPFPIPDNWKRYRVMDFGYTHPACVTWWAADGDGRLYRYREIYYTGRTTIEHIQGVNGQPGIATYSAGEEYEAPMICDHDAEDRAVLEKAGIPTIGAKKDIKTGIEKVQERLKIQRDGRPRIYFLRGARVEVDEQLELMFKPTCTEEEFGGYVWRNIEDQKEVSTKDEVPIDLDNHGLDTVRYLIAHIDEGSGSAKIRHYA